MWATYRRGIPEGIDRRRKQRCPQTSVLWWCERRESKGYHFKIRESCILVCHQVHSYSTPLLVTTWKASPVPIMVTYEILSLSCHSLILPSKCVMLVMKWIISGGGGEINIIYLSLHLPQKWISIVEQRDSHHCSVKDAVQTQISVRAVVVASSWWRSTAWNEEIGKGGKTGWRNREPY